VLTLQGLPLPCTGADVKSGRMSPGKCNVHFRCGTANSPNGLNRPTLTRMRPYAAQSLSAHMRTKQNASFTPTRYPFLAVIAGGRVAAKQPPARCEGQLRRGIDVAVAQTQSRQESAPGEIGPRPCAGVFLYRATRKQARRYGYTRTQRIEALWRLGRPKKTAGCVPRRSHLIFSASNGSCGLLNARKVIAALGAKKFQKAEPYCRFVVEDKVNP